jgi:iron complex transport system substrate-binding protein
VPAALSPFRPRRAALLPALTATALLAACAGTPSSPPTTLTPTSATAAATAGTAHTTYPLTLDNCGFSVTVKAAPQRIVTIKSSATEMVLALGAGDRIVGTGFPDGPVPADLAAGAALPALSDKVPAAEVVLAAQPDLVYGGWESNLTAEGAGDRATLAGLGVATYVAPSACKEPQYQPDRLTFDDVFAEITEAASILDTGAAADELIATQRAALAGVTPDTRGVTALWYSSGDDVPYVGAGIGAPQMIMDALGLTNIAAGVKDTWTAFSWEEVAQQDPDVIVLVDATWNSAEQKKQKLAANPATANLTAVKNQRYLVVPFAATEAGVRNVPATVDLATQLAAVDLG